MVDTHAHLLFQAFNRLNPEVPGTVDTLLAQMRQAGVARAGVVTMAPRGDMERTRRENDQLLAAVHAHPDRFFAIASVHPDDGDDALAELERVARAGAKAIKLHPNTQQFDLAAPSVAAVVAKTAELGLVVLFDGYSPFDAGQLGKFLVLAVSHPKARLVIAHVGGPRFAELGALVAVMKQYPWYARNLWVDLSAMSVLYARSPYAEQFAWAVRAVGTDRALFGSDFPAYSEPSSVTAVSSLGFDAAEQRAIFHDNAVALFGL
jgi:hypothetical protein